MEEIFSKKNKKRQKIKDKKIKKTKTKNPNKEDLISSIPEAKGHFRINLRTQILSNLSFLVKFFFFLLFEFNFDFSNYF